MCSLGQITAALFEVGVSIDVICRKYCVYKQRKTFIKGLSLFITKIFATKQCTKTMDRACVTFILLFFSVHWNMGQ